MRMREEWGEWVRRAIGERSYTKVGRAIGRSKTYIGEMVAGWIPPDPQTIIDLAMATDSDPDEGLTTAGYAPRHREGAWNPAQAYVSQVREIAAEYRIAIPLTSDDLPGPNATPDQVAAAVENARAWARSRNRRKSA